MFEYAEELIKLNRYNPKVVYTLTRTIENMVSDMKKLPCITKEHGELHEKLKSLKVPVYNDIYRRLFGDFCEQRLVDVPKTLRTYKLDLVLYNISLVDDLRTFSNEVLATNQIGYNQPHCKATLINATLKFLELYNSGDELMWTYYHWIDKMVVRGLRRNMIYKKDILDVITIMGNVNQLKKTIINNFYKEDVITRQMLLDSIELQDKFLDSRTEFERYCQEKMQGYLNDYKSDNKHNNQILYDTFLSERQQYLGQPKSKELVMFLEYIELKIQELPVEFLYYHTPEETFECFKECSYFLNVFNRSIIKDTVLTALTENGEGLYKRYETVNDKEFVQNNLDILIKYGMISPEEYMKIMESFE